MKKTLFVYFVFVFILSKTLFGQERPNILFVLIDDMGYGDLRCYGNKVHETPHIDRMAQEGVRFTQYYVSSPICSPSRTGVITGQYPSRWGITSFIDDRKANKERGMKDFLDLKAPSAARNLHESGYYTAHIGKWHLGGGRDIGDVPYITEFGFDESVTQFEGIGERFLDTYETLGLPDSTRNLEKMSAALGKGEVHWIKRENDTRAFVDRAIKAMKTAQAANKPFYINLWPNDVHIPLEPPRNLRGSGSTKDNYAGVIKEMDNQLGKVFDYINQNPALQNNTIIVIASDNGPAPKVGSAGNLRGHKGNLFEGGVRDPLIVWAPKIIPADQHGKVNSKTVIVGMDLPVSFIKIAGAKPTKSIKYDGLDMSRTLLGYEQPTRKEPVMWQRPPEKTKKAVDNPDLAIREGDYKLLMNIDGNNVALYNLASDESETTNIAAKFPEVAKTLKDKLTKWYSEMPPMVKRYTDD
jgi:arylsulfatase A-like enzyme